MSNLQKLNLLKAKAQKDSNLPLRGGAKNLVFGEGNPEAKLYILGEAPGRSEDELGRPFVGRAGKLLDSLLESIGIKREEVWISNMVYFRPPENRPPIPREIEVFSGYVDEQLEIIDPEVIVALGRFALAKFLPGEKISKVHGRKLEVELNGKKRILIPMYHPSAGLRATNVRKILEEDFRKNEKLLK